MKELLSSAKFEKRIIEAKKSNKRHHEHDWLLSQYEFITSKS